MSLVVVVGGQYGSEGKGKVTSYLSMRDDVDIVVRCGGPNSGHTVDIGAVRHELRSLPSGFVNGRTRLLLASGSLIEPSILLTEIKRTGIDRRRLGIDQKAGTLLPKYSDEEGALHLRDRLGSTLSGTGVGVANRVLRTADFRLARDVPELREFLTDVSEEVNGALDHNGKVIIEGTQGFGLSLYHAFEYPYATSRDTTVAAFLSEVGVSPRLVTDIVMAVRTFPIRVAGNSGPLANEISWDDVRSRSGYPSRLAEYTTTTKRLRRVGLFDDDLVRKAAMVNRPTQIALHGADYLAYVNKAIRDFDCLDPSAVSFVESLERLTNTPVLLIGTGPTNEELVDRTMD